MRSLRIGIAVGVALVLVAATPAPRGPGRAAAQTADIEAQAQQLERQLLCPQCTNKRLDVCELPICRDMKLLIRQQLETGALPEDILLFFSNRYGDRVLAELPKEGFALWLWGWTGASMLLAVLAAAWQLRRGRMRARGRARRGASADAPRRAGERA